MNQNILACIRTLTRGDRKTLHQKVLKVAEEAGELAKVVLPFESAHGTTHRFIDRTRVLEEVCDTILTALSITCHLDENCDLDWTLVEAGRIPAQLPSQPHSQGLTHLGIEVMRHAGSLAGAVASLDSQGSASVMRSVNETVRSALAVAAALGCDAQAVAAMLNRKMLKWADLQARDAGVQYPLPYELHVTVAQAEIEPFRAVCAALGVKPIVLDLHMKSGGVVKDVMTSSMFFGDNPGSLAELRRIADGLAAAGFEVLREKIETVPWHPAAPSRRHAAPVMPKDCYFECHLNIVANEERRGLLKLIADASDAHLSRNVFKRLKNDQFTIMLTYRRYDGVFEEFRDKVEDIKSLLQAACFDVEKEIVEFSIYDTKVHHDASWLLDAAAEAA